MQETREGQGNQTAHRAFILIVSLLLVAIPARPQSIDSLIQHAPDPCGYPDTTTALYRLQALANWGYGYDSLLVDLSRWAQSPFVRIDTIGFSVQQRGLFMLTVEDTVQPSSPRKRVWIHARTHPSEVQGTWATNQMIAILLSDLPLARMLRDSCVFNILPMLNPDGVELARPRENANNVDLESNWSAFPGEPEVQALRATFGRLMGNPNPIRAALNMHSSISCTRYFVYHASGGTSALYATIEQQFINLVRSYFPGGIEPYTYFVSWTTSAPTYYPESWFWYNYREAVLALTYEDMNCAQAGEFDKTAMALLHGTGEFLGVLPTPSSVATRGGVAGGYLLSQNYPNPFNATTQIEYDLAEPGQVTLRVYDLLGRQITVLVNEVQAAGSHTTTFEGTDLATGIYLYRLQVRPTAVGQPGERLAVGRMVLLR